MPKFEVASTFETFWALHAKLQNREPFVYTRFGDGELDVLLGGGGGGQLPDPDLTQETWDLFHNPDPRNMLALARHKDEEHMRPGMFQAWNDPKYAFADQPRRFENAIALHYYAVFKPNVLGMLFELIRNRPKIYVGALDDREKLEAVWGQYFHVPVPEYNSYSTIHLWYSDLLSTLDQIDEPVPLILVAAGPAKCAAAQRLLEVVPRQDVQFVDLGSVVDMLLRVPSRTWIREALK